MSTGLDLTSVEKLQREGKVWHFKVPKDVFDEWMKTRKVEKMLDNDIVTGVLNEEIRIQKPASGEMNRFITRDIDNP